jgi:hypothetical protein
LRNKGAEMKKIYVCLAFLTLLGFSGFAEKNTKIVALECNAGMFLTYGISANLDFNFGSFFAANGFTLHASFIWDTHNWFVLFYEDENQW